MTKDGDPWEMRMPAFGQKEINLDNALKPDSNSDTPETDWIVDHYSEDGIGELIKKCRQLERRLSIALSVVDAKETYIKNLIANTDYKWASKEAIKRGRGVQHIDETDRNGGNTILPKYKFKNVICSQCGKEFGPGNNQFSHCENHKHI